MLAFDPTSGIPARWSLRPEDTLGLLFWTKDPSNLILDAKLLQSYKVKVHMTLTGWEEVEKGAPSLLEGVALLAQAVETFGPENVTWRFSPVPLVSDVVARFQRILDTAAKVGLRQVYVSFLQENDLVPETRSDQERLELLIQLSDLAKTKKVKVLLCNEDNLLLQSRVKFLVCNDNLRLQTQETYSNLTSGVCVPPAEFELTGSQPLPSEGCGCVLTVDPFTVNESCNLGCAYCYAADKSLTPKKRNTTKKSLQVLQ